MSQIGQTNGKDGLFTYFSLVTFSVSTIVRVLPGISK